MMKKFIPLSPLYIMLYVIETPVRIESHVRGCTGEGEMKPSSATTVLLLIAFSTVEMVRADDPTINQRLPIKERSNLSPPIVEPPIHECALAVKVSGFVPKAMIHVFANGSELVGTANPKHGPAEVPLKRPLVLGDVITATQTVAGVTSVQSYDGI